MLLLWRNCDCGKAGDI